MVGVQDEEPCPQCGAMAFCEFQTRTSEFWKTCFECGYHKSVITLKDNVKQKRIAKEVKELVANNKMMEAAKILGREDWVKVEGDGWKDINKIPLGQYLINEAERIQWFKFTKDKKIIQRVYEKQGHGGYTFMPKNGVGQSGCLPADKERCEEFLEGLRKAKAEGHTVHAFIFENGRKVEVI